MHAFVAVAATSVATAGQTGGQNFGQTNSIRIVVVVAAAAVVCSNFDCYARETPHARVAAVDSYVAAVDSFVAAVDSFVAAVVAGIAGSRHVRNCSERRIPCCCCCCRKMSNLNNLTKRSACSYSSSRMCCSREPCTPRPTAEARSYSRFRTAVSRSSRFRTAVSRSSRFRIAVSRSSRLRTAEACSYSQGTIWAACSCVAGVVACTAVAAVAAVVAVFVAAVVAVFVAAVVAAADPELAASLPHIAYCFYVSVDVCECACM